ILVTLAAAGLTLALAPAANREFQRQLFRILQARAVSGLQERVFSGAFGDVVIYVQDISASQLALHRVLVSDERDPTITRIITAREGRLISDEMNRSVTLRLIDGAVNEADVMPADPPKDLDTKEVRTSGGAASAARYRYTRFNIYDMSLSVESPLRGRRGEKPEKDLTLSELNARIAELRHEAYGRAPFEIELHKRWALPLAALVFGLVAFPLAARTHRGGRSVALVGSLLILMTYYLVMTSLEGAALGLRIPAWLAIWTPNVLFAVVGLVFLVVTTLEWKWPAMPSVWRRVEVLRRAMPGPDVWRRRWRRGGPSRDSTPLLDRHLLPPYPFP